MNYEPIVAGTQSNGFVGTKASDNAGQARKETEPVKNYILLPLWHADPPYSQDPKSSQDDESKPSSDDGNKVDEDSRKDGEGINQEKEDNVTSTKNVNAASTNEVNVVGGKTRIELSLDPNMSELEDYSIFKDDEDVGAEADMHNLNTVSPIPTTRIHKVYPLDQVIGDLQSATQIRRMSKSLEEHGFVSTIQQRTNHKGLQNCLFACFLSQEEHKKVIHALKDSSWIEAMQEELLQFKLQEVWTLVDLPNGKRAIGTKWVFRNKKDERGFVQWCSIGELTFFLGLKVQHKKDEIFISQDKYVGEILKKFRFTEVKTASTPMETQKPLLKDEDVCVCARYQVNLKVSHLYAVKRIFSSRNRQWLEIPQQKLNKWLLQVAVDKRFGFRINYLIIDLLTKAFDATVKAKTVNGKLQLQALVDGKKIIITESIVRRDLQLEDAEGVDCLPNATIFEQLTLMGSKTTAWNEFSSTMASAIIYLATNQKFNFSKYVFESMVKNLDNVGKILMYPRFVQVFVNQQLKGMPAHKRIYITPSHTEKIFGNMRKARKDEAVNKEMDASLVRAATTATGLEAEQDCDGGPRRQETMRDTIAQTRFENVSKLSNDPLLARVLALETTKTTQANEIACLKRKVKKLKRRNKSRAHWLKRLYKIGLYRRVESFGDEEDLGENASKQGRRIHDIDADEDIALVNDDNEMFDVGTLTGDEVLAKQVVAAKDVNLSVDEVSLAQALAALKSAKV
ncbi:putative ribonuclease H-like domain-containing protein [Tanacetum coccineum]